MNAHQAIERLGGTDRVSIALGLSQNSIREARRKNQFPASWFDPLDRLGKETGVAIPRDLFSWRKSSEDSEPETSAPVSDDSHRGAA